MSCDEPAGLTGMLIVAGHLTVDPTERQRFVVDCAAAVTAARAAEGCLDFAVSADPVDPSRVNVFERWDSPESLQRFRGSGPDTDMRRRILHAEVAEYHDIDDPRSRPGRPDGRLPGVTDFVHVGLVVEDLDEIVRFLALLGFRCGEPGRYSGEWIDRIIGLEQVEVELVMARAPDGSDVFEVVRFHAPLADAHEASPAANRPGLRHIAFRVDDVRAVVARVREAGWDTVGDIVDYEGAFSLCYVRGPEGLIVELAQRLEGAPA